MNTDPLELLRELEAKEKMQRNKEIECYPLSQYSTTQLKEELRRRKKEKGGIR